MASWVVHSNALVMIDRARSLVYHAACCFDHEAEETEQAARMAKSAASDAGRFMSDRSVQLHGGIGVDREYPLHRYYVYQRHLELTLGSGTPTLLALGRLLAAETA